MTLLLLVLSIQSCNKDDDASSVEAKPLSPEEQENDKEFEENTGNAITLYGIDGENIVKIRDYDVEGGNLELQKDVSKHMEIWELVKKIVPSDYLPKIKEFKIYAGIFKEKDNVVAGYVVPDNSLSVWQMGIAIDYAYLGGFNKNNNLTFTITHEFGHILTLNKTQLDGSVEKSNCTNFFIDELKACSKKEAYINKFENEFWKDIWGDYTNAQSTESGKKEFYEKYESHFITEYASSTIKEDIAEVFSFFVAIDEKPIDNSVKYLKINSMYNYPELISLRNYIRGNISKSSKTNKIFFAPRIVKVANRELKIHNCRWH